MIARLATAAVGIPLLVLVVWVGEPWFTLVVAGLAGIGAVEVCRMQRIHDRRAQILIGSLAAVLVLSATSIADVSAAAIFPEILLLLLGVAAAITLANRKLSDVATWRWRIGWTALGYPGALLAHAPLLRGIDQGVEWVFFLLIVTFSTDTAAFFVGRAIGKRPLALTISPNKTWEGAIGGFLAAIVAATVAANALDIDAAIATILLLGALMGIVGQAGDLVESRVKRLASVKDSGWLFPGHGGVLDRLDSIVFNLVLVYYFVIWGVQ